MKKRARVTQWYTILGTTQQRQSKTSCNLNPLQTVMAASSWTDLFRKYMKSERPRGSQNKDTTYLHVDVDISCRIMSWPRFVDQAASHKHAKNPALNNKWSYYIHIFIYSCIHVYSYIYMHTISYEHGKQVNKWTQARNDKWNPDMYWKTWKTFKTFVHMKWKKMNGWLVSSYFIYKIAHEWNKTNRRNNMECDECQPTPRRRGGRGAFCS